MQVNTMIFVWLGLLVLFLAVEFATAQLTTVWFAAGALVSLLLASFGVDNLAIQIIVFTLVSLVSLILTRPLVKKWTRAKKQPTNADMVIGEEAVVTETISNTDGKGLAKVNGAIWSARSVDDSIIPAGKTVTVRKIEGVKLIVEP
ncbi:MAG: NfeD family protein [Clostridia bacterium]|nr:NfeD family protein [Clostridia bacterium]